MGPASLLCSTQVPGHRAQLRVAEEGAGGPSAMLPLALLGQRLAGQEGGNELRGLGASQAVAVQEEGAAGRNCHPALEVGRERVPTVCSAGGDQAVPEVPSSWGKCLQALLRQRARGRAGTGAGGAQLCNTDSWVRPTALRRASSSTPQSNSPQIAEGLRG